MWPAGPVSWPSAKRTEKTGGWEGWMRGARPESLYCGWRSGAGPESRCSGLKEEISGGEDGPNYDCGGGGAEDREESEYRQRKVQRTEWVYRGKLGSAEGRDLKYRVKSNFQQL